MVRLETKRWGNLQCLGCSVKGLRAGLHSKARSPASIMALRAAAPLQHCDSISAQAIHSGVVCSGEAATFRVCVSIWAFTYILRTPLLSRYGSAAQHASHSDGMRGLDVEQPSLRFLGLLTLADWYADWTDVPSIMAGLKCLRTASPEPAGVLLQKKQPLISLVCLAEMCCGLCSSE